MSKSVLVLNCFEHTLTAIRSLATSGYEIVLGVTSDEMRHGYAHFSKYVHSTWLHPNIAGRPAEFDTALLQYLSQDNRVDVVFPVGESALHSLVRIRSRIPSDILIAMPDNETVEVCLSKIEACRTAEQCQIPVPGTRRVGSVEQLRAAIADLGYPCIAKPNDSRSALLGLKCVFLRSESDLDALIRRWPDCPHELVVQNQICGPRFNCDIVAQDGRVCAYFESRIHRTNRADGSGISVCDQSIRPTPEHRRYCEEFVSRLGYTGAALVQFLRDEHTGKSFFLEANPRLGATIALAVSSGVDVPALSVAAHSGNCPIVDDQYPVGRLQHWLDGDLLGLRKAVKESEVGITDSVEWLASCAVDFIRADCRKTFRWDDPKPTIRLFGNLFARLLGRAA